MDASKTMAMRIRTAYIHSTGTFGAQISGVLKTAIQVVLLLVSLTLASCSRSSNDISYNDITASSRSIQLSNPWFGDFTKGVDPLQNTNLVNFGVSAIKNFDGVNENQWYLSDQPVVKGIGSNPWAINPTAYWPLSGNLSFFFHAPSNISYPEIRFIETTTGMPKVEFTPSTTDIAGQIDFCIGHPVMHCTANDNPIPVTFEHALTRISFYVNYIGVVPPGYFVMIDSLKIKNVAGTNTATYLASSPYFAWDNVSAYTNSAEYVLDRTKTHIRMDSLRKAGTITENGGYQLLTNTPGRLYLLPQTLGPEARLEVTYGLYTNWGASPTVIGLFAKEVPLPEGQVWPAGKMVNYKVTVDVGISSPLQLSSTITDWTPSGNIHTQYEFE